MNADGSLRWDCARRQAKVNQGLSTFYHQKTFHFLLSDMSTWVHGTNIPADGGVALNIPCELHRL